MRLRIRFVLIFTLIVSVILIICLGITLLSYSSLDKSRFDQRLEAYAQSAFSNYFQLPHKSDSFFLEPVRSYQFLLLDSAGNVLVTNSSTSEFPISNELLHKTRNSGSVNFMKDSLQGVSMFVTANGHKAYVMAIGNNLFGRERIESLRWIIVLVTLCGIIFTALFAMYYVLWVTRPLVDLSSQMRHITENNLNQKITIPKGNAKHNEIYIIAANFNDMLDRLARAFQQQKNFVHHASHELRTPLATMLAQTESALRKNLTPEEAVSVLKSLKEDQQEMIDLTNSLLLLSQYENVQYSKNWPKIRIDEVVFDTIVTSKKLLPEIDIAFDFDPDPEQEAFLIIPGNETLLRSAIRNLIKNAFQYSPDKKVQLVLEADELETRVTVENKGEIVPPEDTERLFLPFFRGKNSRNKKGSGLGLPIVKRICELHKGTLSYKSVGDNLNRFRITFKRKPAA